MTTITDSARELLDDLISHVHEVKTNASTKLNEKLFDECCLFLAPALAYDQTNTISLIALLSELLPTLQQDPSPPLRLLSKVVQPFTFRDVLSLQPPVDFIAGLNPLARPYHGLMLELLAKATHRQQDAELLAGMPSVIIALVYLWLCSPEIGIGDRAGKILTGILAVDRSQEHMAISIGDVTRRDVETHMEDVSTFSQGLTWKRFFGDKDVYGLLFACTASSGPSTLKIGDQDLELSHDRSVAQARLMGVLPEIGSLDWQYVSSSQHVQVETQYGLEQSNSGLLEFVCSHMADSHRDPLVDISRYDFFASLITRAREIQPGLERVGGSVSLAYLVDHGHHKRIAEFIMQDTASEDVEHRLLLPSAAHYWCQYVSIYKHSFLYSAEYELFMDRISSRLNLSQAAWASGSYSVHDLAILTALPRISLLRGSRPDMPERPDPLLRLEIGRANDNALNALSVIFSGRSTSRREADGDTIGTPSPLKQSDQSPSMPHAESESQQPWWTCNDDLAEARAAAVIFKSYIITHKEWAESIVKAADLIALTSTALAALNLLRAIITAQWAPIDPIRQKYISPPGGIHDFADPRQSDRCSLSSVEDPAIFPPHLPDELIYPLAPMRRLLSEHSEHTILNWLLAPPQYFPVLRGGRGEAESSALRVASAKFDIVKITRDKLALLAICSEDGDLTSSNRPLLPIAKMWAKRFEERVSQGLWGAQEVGQRIATLEL